MISILAFLACTPPVSTTGTELISDLPDADPPPPFDTEKPLDPVEDSGDPVVVPPEIPAVYLNEIMLDNVSYANSFGDTSDWVEIYNGTENAIALSSLMLSDSSGAVWLGGSGELPAHGYLVVYADSGATRDGAPFSLSSDGDTLTLTVDGITTDRIATGALGEDLVWARIPDGGTWFPSAWVTVGETNGDAPSDTLEIDPFRIDQITDVNLTISTQGMSQLAANPTAYVEAGINIGGYEIDPVGVRLRGSASFLPISSKAGFKIDFNRYEPYAYRGIQKINMLNMSAYNSGMKEFSIYHMARELGVLSPLLSYARVAVNNSNYGLYLFSEAYDDEFMGTYFGTEDGVMIWEPNSGDINSGVSGYWDCEIGPCDPNVVERVSDILSGTPSEAALVELDRYLAVDEVLMLMAVEMSVGDWDGYCGSHNYRVHYNPGDDRIYLSISSVDLSIYGSTPSITSCNASVMRFCTSVPSCDARWTDTLNRMADWIEDNDYPGYLTEVRDMIEYDMTHQGKRPINQADFLTEANAVIAWYQALPGALRNAAQ